MSTPPASIVRVAVFKSGNQYLVRPPTVFLLKNKPQADALRVSNHAGEGLQIEASGPWPFSTNPELPVPVPSGGQVTLELADGIARGAYAYKVKVASENKYALGNSDPVVIVEDP